MRHLLGLVKLHPAPVRRPGLQAARPLAEPEPEPVGSLSQEETPHGRPEACLEAHAGGPQPGSQPLVRRPGRVAVPRQDEDVVGHPNQRCGRPVPRPGPVQDAVQVDIQQQRREAAPLRDAPRRVAVGHHDPDQLDDVVGGQTRPDDVDQPPQWDVIECVLDVVRCPAPRAIPLSDRLGVGQRVFPAASRPIAVAGRREARVEERLDHLDDRPLDDAILDVADTQRPEAAAGPLGDSHLAVRSRSVSAGPDQAAEGSCEPPAGRSVEFVESQATRPRGGTAVAGEVVDSAAEIARIGRPPEQAASELGSLSARAAGGIGGLTLVTAQEVPARPLVEVGGYPAGTSAGGSSRAPSPAGAVVHEGLLSRSPGPIPADSGQWLPSVAIYAMPRTVGNHRVVVHPVARSSERFGRCNATRAAFAPDGRSRTDGTRQFLPGSHSRIRGRLLDSSRVAWRAPAPRPSRDRDAARGRRPGPILLALGRFAADDAASRPGPPDSRVSVAAKTVRFPPALAAPRPVGISHELPVITALTASPRHRRREPARDEVARLRARRPSTEQGAAGRGPGPSSPPSARCTGSRPRRLRCLVDRRPRGRRLGPGPMDRPSRTSGISAADSPTAVAAGRRDGPGDRELAVRASAGWACGSADAGRQGPVCRPLRTAADDDRRTLLSDPTSTRSSPSYEQEGAGGVRWSRAIAAEEHLVEVDDAVRLVREQSRGCSSTQMSGGCRAAWAVIDTVVEAATG